MVDRYMYFVHSRVMQRAATEPPAPAHEYAEGPAYFAERDEHERVAAAVAAWSPYLGDTYLPTRQQCNTGELDFYAERLLAGWRGMRSQMVATRLEQLGLTLPQIQAWSECYLPARHLDSQVVRIGVGEKA